LDRVVERAATLQRIARERARRWPRRGIGSPSVRRDDGDGVTRDPAPSAPNETNTILSRTPE